MKGYTMTFKHDNGAEYAVNITAKTREQIRLVEEVQKMTAYYNITARTDEWQAGGLQGMIDAMFVLGMVEVDGEKRMSKSYDFGTYNDIELKFKHRIEVGSTSVVIEEA